MIQSSVKTLVPSEIYRLKTAQAMPSVSADTMVRLGVVFLLAMAAFVGAATWGDQVELFQTIRSHWLLGALLSVAKVAGSLTLAVLGWRVALAFRYRAIESVSDEELPEITVIVPAYNEGKQVLYTLRSLARSNYPKGKLHIIGVDDGSQDDTWVMLQRGARQYPGLVEVIHCEENRGKRHALNEGFRRSLGEVIVTVDSDSEVDRQTLRNLVSPFVRDEKVGGVAGNVRVLNREEGLIPRMLDVSFNYSFDFMRAGQSVINSVMCTPGALSAYRRDVVLEVLDEWLGQTFCGQPANIGEDRAMTNLILRSGRHVTYQRNALVFTKVPTPYQGLCKMMLRWARSNVRETIAMSRFAFRRFRDGGAWGTRLNLVMSWISLTLGQLMWVPFVLFWVMSPVAVTVNVLWGTAVAASLMAVVYALGRRSWEGIWAFPYTIFSFFALSWIQTYAIFTPHKNGWLTRNLPQGTP
jgi:hyaluronan synthase